ncbi:hypothetical protein BDB00DRAFT_763857, partial [Zychaea mexicana]|uniref:uncharacterized protein n=1 Tax=Zychaea mexicana TaxID=64656 RepID=UPI0022FF164B
TPSGLLISQKYVKFTSVTLSTKVLGKTKKILVKSPIKEKINKIKQVNAFIPNFVHSMDGSHVALLIKEILSKEKNINILTVHDCFATNANDVYIL